VHIPELQYLYISQNNRSGNALLFFLNLSSLLFKSIY